MPRSLPLVIVFTSALFVSAFLLFLVQPLQARMVLPQFGGSPAVWNTCMVFFQAALLLGYGYAHLLPTWFGTRRHALFHLAVLATPALVLPVALPAGWLASTSIPPVFSLLGLLALTVGLPFFCVSTSAPLLQRWFTATGHPGAHDPYFLYAASNVGSILALLSYPVAIEPLFALGSQSLLWAAGYYVFFLLTLACAATLWFLPRTATKPSDVPVPPAPTPPARPITWRRRLRWLLLAFVPSSFMLGVTTYLTTDVAPIPLLWVLPLAVYLLTFVLVFARKPPFPHAVFLRWMPLIVIVVLVLLLSEATDTRFGGPSVALLLVLHLLALFWIGMVSHGELAGDRPSGEHLTEFYLILSAGGVLGGLFNALVAPVIFPTILEYPVVLVLACLLRPPAPTTATEPPSPPPVGKKHKRKPQPRPVQPTDLPLVFDVAFPLLLGCVTVALVLTFQAMRLNPGPESVAAMFAVPLVVCYLFKDRPVRFALGVTAILLASGLYYGMHGKSEFLARSFFGVHRVTEDPFGPFRDLWHGSTQHGMQNAKRPRDPLMYYNRTGPIGQVFNALQGNPNVKRVGVVGLGCGTLSCYAERGQQWTYYEIDPVVKHVAHDSRLFTYLSVTADVVGVEPDIVLGDAHLTLAAADAKYDVLVIVAFSSDAIPVHLLTREALAIFLAHLSDDGILAFHISNRYLDLEPILGDLAGSVEPPPACLGQTYQLKPGEKEDGYWASSWVVMARKETILTKVNTENTWHRVEKRPGVRVWTDDYSNLLGAWRWQE